VLENSMLRSMRCCLNPKVIGGLGAVGLVIWLMAPGDGAAALPLLITLVCPLSMGVMMWQMRRSGGSCSAAGAGGPSPAASPKVEEDLRQAREELAIERARQRLAGGGSQSPV
jgi:hypothetical protein